MEKTSCMGSGFGHVIIGTIIGVWIVVSVLYIGRDIWTDFQNQEIRQAYDAGVTTAVAQLIQESAKCEPISVFVGDNSVELIAIPCLAGGAGVETE